MKKMPFIVLRTQEAELGGRDLTVEQGYQAARDAGLNLLAVVRESLGSLDKVKRV